MRRLAVLAALYWISWVAGCAGRPPVAPTPTAVAVVTTAPTATPSPTLTATPLPTAPPPPTAAPPPTATPRPSRTPTTTPTPTPSATPFVDRSCSTRHFPNYNRYWLDGRAWPTPTAEEPLAPHFWLANPLDVNTERYELNRAYPYGYDGGTPGELLLHNGLDQSDELGTPVRAAADGVVVFARSDAQELHGWRCNWYGQFVVILHDRQWQGRPIYTLYGHVLNIAVREGQRVRRGQPIAEVGFGGAAPVRHLHLEVRVGDNSFFTTRNPHLWLAPQPGRGVLAGRLVDPAGRPWQGVAVNATPLDPDTPAVMTWSYLGDPLNIIQPDDALAENFVFGELPAGDYTLVVALQGELYRETVTVVAGGLTTVSIVTAPFKTPTPTAAPTATR